MAELRPIWWHTQSTCNTQGSPSLLHAFCHSFSATLCRKFARLFSTSHPSLPLVNGTFPIRSFVALFLSTVPRFFFLFLFVCLFICWLKRSHGSHPAVPGRFCHRCHTRSLGHSVPEHRKPHRRQGCRHHRRRRKRCPCRHQIEGGPRRQHCPHREGGPSGKAPPPPPPFFFFFFTSPPPQSTH